jgi:4'-phosphopantetheinyl transferase
MTVSLPIERLDARLRACAGAVDVWHVDLDTAAEGLEELLSAVEQARAERIVRERSRLRWARSRGVLRALLGRYLKRDPRELRFAPGPYGKPALGGPGGRAPDLRFNLSHSGERMLVAVTVGREVGVDIECARVGLTAEFLRAWTVREATVKCLGTGLGSGAVVAEDDSATGGRTAGLWTAELDAGPRAAAAVASEGGQERELRRRDWPA